MDQYKYTVQLRYNKQKERISQEINPMHIKSIIIDRDYIKNNLPVIFMTLSIEKSLIDHMIENSKSNTMVLTIYKYIYRESKLATKTKYIHEEMAYFIQDDLNYRASVDYNDDENDTEIYRTINIGLMGINSINNNKKTVNTILRNTTMMNAVQYCTSHMNMIIERFNYNESMKELLIKPQSSVAKTIAYLNGIKVFYKTPYRFFIDFDCGYLLSSSGTSVPRKGESINSILIIIRDPLNPNALEEGMITNYDTKNYQIDVSAADTQVYLNKITEKVYTAVSSISESGQTKSQSLNINQSKYSKDKTEIIRTPSSNPNLIQNITASNNQTSASISLNKTNIDGSVFTPNKRYVIKNFDGHKDRDGDFILTRKRELFFFETEESFTGNVMMEFKQVIK